MKRPRPPTDTRKESRQFARSLLIMTLLTLVVGGTVLVALGYGGPIALVSFLCLAMGAIMLLALWLILTAVEKAVE
jgi:hypothetical protein